MERVTLVTVHNAFERKGRDTRTIMPGITLQEIKASYLPVAVDFAISVNGHTVTDLETIPRAGDMVVAVPVLAGGSDGKMIGRIIAMVVIAVISYGIGAIAGAGYLGYSAAALYVAQNAALIGAAIMIVGGVVISMAFAGGAPKGLATYGSDATTSPAYSWAPQSTQQQGTVIPKWYGRNKLYGNIIVATIKYSDNNSYINALINLGFGPFSALSNYQVNDQPIENFMGIVAPDVRLGLLDQTVVADFASTTVEYNTSQLVTNANPVIYTTQGNSFDSLEVMVQFPRGLGYYNDLGNLVPYSVAYRISYRRSGAATYTVATFSTYSAYLSNGGHWSDGTWYTEEGHFDGEGWVPGATYWYEFAAGSTNFLDHVEGDPGTMLYGFFWHWVGSPATLYTGVHDYVTATGAQSNPLRIAYVIPITVADYYDIKVERLTNDFTTTREIGELYLATIKEITGQSFTYPRQVLVGLNALASNQLSGSLRFSCIADCSLVRVFNGTTWAVEYSTNPAWICFDVLSQPVFSNANAVLRYDGIDPARIDHVKFKEWADYCDELLPDGSGGTEPRISFNGGFDSEMSLWEAVLRICSVAYATPVWNGINLSVIIDKPADPVQLFSLGNIDQDSFKETFLPMSDRAAEIEVDFVNQENNYQRDKLTVINTAMTTVTSKVTVNMFGITKPSMAWRAAMRKLAYNQHITRTLEFGADIDAIACTVGDVVLIQHDVPQWGYGGRLVAATTTQVTIDQTVTLAPGTQYAILVRLADDSLVERDITNVAGDANTTAGGDATVLTISPAFTTAPAQFDVFTMGEILTTSKPFRISNITRSSDLKAQISAVEYVAGVYNVDYNIPVTGLLDYTQSLTSYKQALPPFVNITGITGVESVRKHVFGIVYTVVDLHWTPAANRFAFPLVEVWAWQDGQPPKKQTYTPISISSLPVMIQVDGCYWNFAVGCVNLNGEAQKVSDLQPLRQFVYGKTLPPSDVMNFSATPVITGGVRFAWTSVADVDVLGYVIKYTPVTTGGSWFDSSELTRTAANYANLNAALTGTYFIKAVDTTGNYSLTATELTISTVPGIVGLTSYALIEEHPTWGGTLDNLTGPVGGELSVAWTGGGTAPVDQITGTYTTGTEIDFGELRTARVTAKCTWHVKGLSGSFDAIPSFEAVVGLDGETGRSDVQAYIYTSQDASAPTYKQPLFAGDFTFRRAKFTIEVLRCLPDSLDISALTITVDTHDTIVTL